MAEGGPAEPGPGVGREPRRVAVACLAPADLRPEVDPLTGEVVVDPRRADLTASDAAALELARRAADEWGGRLVAVAAGPPSIEDALRQAVAVGAEVWRVPWGGGNGHGPRHPATSRGATALTLASRPVPDAPAAAHALDGRALTGDPIDLARQLAMVLMRVGPPDLVICGDRSSLGGTGSVPALLAHYLGAGQALGLVSLRVKDDTVVVERRLDGGWRERLRLAIPAVCSVEAAGVRLRRASLPDALRAAEAPIPVTDGNEAGTGGPGGPGGPGVGAGAGAEPRLGWRVGAPRPYRPRPRVVPPPVGSTRERLLALTGALVDHDPPRLVGPIDADGAVDELLDFLVHHGYLDPQARGGRPPP